MPAHQVAGRHVLYHAQDRTWGHGHRPSAIEQGSGVIEEVCETVLPSWGRRAAPVRATGEATP